MQTDFRPGNRTLDHQLEARCATTAIPTELVMIYIQSADYLLSHRYHSKRVIGVEKGKLCDETHVSRYNNQKLSESISSSAIQAFHM